MLKRLKKKKRSIIGVKCGAVETVRHPFSLQLNQLFLDLSVVRYSHTTNLLTQHFLPVCYLITEMTPSHLHINDIISHLCQSQMSDSNQIQNLKTKNVCIPTPTDSDLIARPDYINTRLKSGHVCLLLLQNKREEKTREL